MITIEQLKAERKELRQALECVLECRNLDTDIYETVAQALKCKFVGTCNWCGKPITNRDKGWYETWKGLYCSESCEDLEYGGC